MSSIHHYCPSCGRDWECEGCDTRAEERLCNDCIDKAEVRGVESREI